MSEFVKKGALNNYKQVPGGQQDPNCSHVILTIEEYESLCRERDRAKEEQRAARNWADSEVRRAIDQGKANLKQAEDTAKDVLEEVGRQLSTAQEEAAHQRGLNENLLRICRERANSDRQLKPKKKHSGFIVLSSAERDYSYRIGKKAAKAKLWETALQSPYSIDFTDEQARRLIEEALLQRKEEQESLMEKLGIDAYYPDKYENMIQDQEIARQAKGKNVMMEQRLRANYRAGYWEVIFFHTRALERIPKKMQG